MLSGRTGGYYENVPNGMSIEEKKEGLVGKKGILKWQSKCKLLEVQTSQPLGTPPKYEASQNHWQHQTACCHQIQARPIAAPITARFVNVKH